MRGNLSLQYPGTLGLVFLAYLLVLLPWGAWRTARRLRGEVPGLPVSRTHYWVSAVLTQAFLLALAWPIGATSGFSLFASPALTPLRVGLGGAALALCFLLRAVALRLLSEGERRQMAVYQRSPRTPAEAAWFVLAAGFAGVAEEAAYRGVGWQVLGYALGSTWIAAAILSVAFALAHWNQGWKSGVVIVAFAAVLHGLVALTGTLVVAMIVHVLYDLVAGWLISRQARLWDREAPAQAV